jgi:hypothetical protein
MIQYLQHASFVIYQYSAYFWDGTAAIFTWHIMIGMVHLPLPGHIQTTVWRLQLYRLLRCHLYNAISLLQPGVMLYHALSSPILQNHLPYNAGNAFNPLPHLPQHPLALPRGTSNSEETRQQKN